MLEENAYVCGRELHFTRHMGHQMHVQVHVLVMYTMAGQNVSALHLKLAVNQALNVKYK